MANIKIDPTKSALANLLAVVDQLNPDSATQESQVTASNIQSVSGVENDPTANTSVLLTAVAGQGFSGSVTVNYERLALSDEAASPTDPCPVHSSQDAASLLATVSAYYGFILAEVQWNAAPVAPGSFPNTTTEVVKCAGSLVYLDGTANVQLAWQD